MHSDLTGALAAANEQELRDRAARRHEPAAESRGDRGSDVVIRSARPSDASQLMELAVLDEAEPPVVPALVAEVCGRLAAVLPLDGGRAYADPFLRSDELLALLELRAQQIASGGWTPRTRFRWPAPPVLRRFAR